MTAGVATKLGIDYAACKAGEARHRLLQHVGVRPRRPARPVRRSRPAVPGVVGARVRVGRGARGQHAALLPLRHVRRVERDAVGRGGARSALYHRKRTGEGQEVWTSLFDGGAIFTSDAHLVERRRPRRVPISTKDLMGLSATYRLYRTQDDDWICVAAVQDDEFAALCNVVGVPEIASDDARSPTGAGRREHRIASSRRSSNRAFGRRRRRFWTRTLDDAGVPNEVPVDTHGGELPLFDADNVELGLVARYEHPLLGDMRQFGELIDFSDTPGADPRPAAARRPGHACDPARARSRRRRDRRARRRRRVLRARRALRRTFRELNAAAAGRVHGRMAGFALRSRRPVLDRAHSRRRSPGCRIRGAPTGCCSASTASATSCASRTTSRRTTLRRAP